MARQRKRRSIADPPIVVALVGRDRFHYAARHVLFPQALAIVRVYLSTRVNYGSVDHREVGLEHYAQAIVERLLTASRPHPTCRRTPATTSWNWPSPATSWAASTSSSWTTSSA